jgi:hypothetical protein
MHFYSGPPVHFLSGVDIPALPTASLRVLIMPDALFLVAFRDLL